jgi:signal peptidase I
MDEARTNGEVSTWWGRMLIGRRPKRTLARLIVLVVASFVLFKFLFIAIRVTGHSMEPTYRDGRINFVNRISYRRHGPNRGDVVALREDGSRLVLMKRVAGLPGERVAVRRGRVIINGVPLDEPYVRGTEIPPTRNETRLKSNEYFVIGDNRDITAYGTVYRHEIIGKVVF